MTTMAHETDQERARSALSFLDYSDEDVWIKAAMCLKSEFGEDGFDMWEDWGSQYARYKPFEAKTRWKSIKPTGGVGIGSLFYDAKAAGWQDDRKKYPAPSREVIEARRAAAAERHAAAEAAETKARAAAASHARFMWDSAQPLEGDEHAYLKRKGVQSHGLRVGAWEKIDPEDCTVRIISEQALLIPIRDSKKNIHSLQAIFPGKVMGDRDKDFVTDGAKSGNFYSFGKPVAVDVQGVQRIVILVGEGYATLASAHAATGHACIVAFDAGNVPKVARVLRERFPDAALVFVADNDQWTEGNPGVKRARAAADEVGGFVAIPPFDYSEGKPDGEEKLRGPSDFNDLHQLRGLDAVREVIEAALEDGARPARIVIAPTESEADGVAYANDCLARLGKFVTERSGAPIAEGDNAIVLAADGNLAHMVEIARMAYPEAALSILAASDQDAEAHRVAELYGASVEMPPSVDDWGGWGKYFLDLLFDRIDAVADEDPAARAAAKQVLAQVAGVADDDDVPGNNGHFAILGHDCGTYFIFKHATGQIAEITKRDLTETGLIELAPLSWWEREFSAGRGSKAPGGINKAAAAEFIFRTAEKRGIYDPDNVRGRGAWIDDGRIVYHHGNQLTVDGNRVGVSEIESSFVYPAARSLPKPHTAHLTAADGGELLELLRQFRWSVPGSALLFAGWIALAPVCGALPWRPHIWISGPAGCGKTTLASLANTLLFGSAVYAGGGSTEPGIRRQLGEDARPVLMDESEAKEEADVQRVRKLIGLIRQASSESGAVTLMGGADGKSQRFNVRSMFCLASIMVATKDKADLDRLTTLALRGKDNERPDDVAWTELRDKKHVLVDRDKTVGRRLLRRCIDLLPTTIKNIEVFTDAAAQRFGAQRQGDQFGTLLAGAWSLTSDEIATRQQALALIDSCDWSEHRDGAEEDDSRRAMNALLGGIVRMDSGVTHTLSDLIAMASGRYGSELGDELIAPKDARKKLGQFGMKVDDIRGSKFIFIGNENAERDRIMAATPYKVGVKGLLLRLPGAMTGEKATGKKTARFPGSNSQGFFVVPLDSVLIGDDNEGGTEPSF